MLIALAAEHTYFLFRYLVRFALNEALWKGSEGEKKLREVQMDLRRDVLGKMEVQFERAKGERDGKRGIWAREMGLEELRKGGKID